MGLMSEIFGGDKGEALGLLGTYLMAGNAPGGFQAAMQHLAGAEDRKRKGLLADLQMENLRSEIDDRKLSREQKAALMKQTQDLLNAPGNYAPGQLGSGSFGAVDVLPGQAPIPAPSTGGLGSVPYEKVVALSAAGGPNLTDAWKYMRTGSEEKPGTFRLMPDGSRRFVPDVQNGRDFQNGRIQAIPGHNDFLTQQTLATELPKAMVTAAGTINLRDNPDGTQRPVSALDENPTLQTLLRGYGMTGPRPSPAAPPAGSPARPVVSPSDQKARDAESISIIQAELQKPGLTPEVKAGLDRELSRLTASQSQPGFPTPTMVNPQGYGMTNEQRAAAEAAKTRAVEQAKADVKPTDQRKASMDSAMNMYSVVTKALQHPGRETATGLSSVLDPRNIIPGTNAKDFRAVLDQIKGAAFLQAFESLKGGGQITQVEGEKATNAIARLQTAQSDSEFKAALEDFQSVIGGAITRMGGQLPGRTQGGKVGPTPGDVEGGYRFKGGNPADPKSWEKV